MKAGLTPGDQKNGAHQPSRGQTGAEGREEELSDKSRQSQSAFPRGALWKKICSSKQLRIFYVLLKQWNIFKGERERRVWFFMWQLWLPAQHGGRQRSHQASLEKSELQVSQEGLKVPELCLGWELQGCDRCDINQLHSVCSDILLLTWESASRAPQRWLTSLQTWITVAAQILQPAAGLWRNSDVNDTDWKKKGGTKTQARPSSSSILQLGGCTVSAHTTKGRAQRSCGPRWI